MFKRLFIAFVFAMSFSNAMAQTQSAWSLSQTFDCGWGVTRNVTVEGVSLQTIVDAVFAIIPALNCHNGDFYNEYHVDSIDEVSGIIELGCRGALPCSGTLRPRRTFSDTPDIPPFCSKASAQNGYKSPNPIIPATGEKIRDEIDYVDAGPHPLSWTRHYTGGRLAATALGQTWSHDYATTLRLFDFMGGLTFSNGNVRTFFAPGRGGNIATSRYAVWPSTTGSANLVPKSNVAAVNGEGWQYEDPEDGRRWIFDSTLKVLSQTQSNGWVTTYSYNAANQLAQITNQFGRSLALAYNTAGKLASVTTPDGGVISYSYDSSARLTGVAYPGGTSKSYLYENAANPQALTGIIDEAGQRTTYAYDAQGRAVSSELATGLERYQVSYGANRSATVTDPLGTQRTYSYSIKNSKIAVAAANLPGSSGLGDAASRSQDDDGLVTQETDFLGITHLYTWESARRLPLSTTKAAGRPEAQTTSTQWHPSFRLPVLVTEPGKTTAYTHDVKGNVLSQTITDAATNQARTWVWTYNPQGLPDSMTDPKGGVTAYTYNPQGLRTSIKNPLNQTSQYSYDAAGRLSTETTPNGLLTTYSYDLRGRLLSAVTGNESTRYSYTPTGQVASISLPIGYQASYTYDPAQRLIAAADNRGNSVSYTLDAMGNRLREEVKDPSGALAQVTSRVINNLNRIAALKGGSGQTTALAFDANGEATSATDPLNHTTRQTLDGLRRPLTTTFADNATATQSWNGLDQLTAATDAKGITTSYQKNAFGDVMVETSPDIGSGGITYQRNAAGEVTSQLDAKGNTTQISRDALGRPLEVRYNPSHIVRYTWDQGQVGYLSKTEDPSGSTTYERDAFGRTLSTTQSLNDNPAAPSSYKTSYTYGTTANTGQLASITYPSGLKVIYRRSANGQITGIDTQVAGRNKPVVPFASAISYTALGQPKAWQWANGDAAARTFDLDGRMASNEFASYTFDAAGRITGISQSLAASLVTTTTTTTVTSGTTTAPVTSTPTGTSTTAATATVSITPSTPSGTNTGTLGGTPTSTISPTSTPTSTVTASVTTGTATTPVTVTVIPTTTTTTSTISSTSYYQSPINWAISYDSRDRITGFNRASAQTSYSYDANSNRLSAFSKTTSDSDLDGDFDQADKAQTTAQALNIDPSSNKLFGFTQTLTSTKGARTLASTTSQVSYALDAAGNMTTDGLRTFSYDSANRHSQTSITKDGEASKITYQHNAAGQRVFKSEPQAAQYQPNEAALGTDFIAWLKSNFSWLFAQAQANATLGQSYVYADSGSQLPGYALLGEYGNGGASSSGRLEYIWLPTEDGDALPIGLFKNGNFFAVHSDHLNTPRKVTDENNKLVWQWPYSAFGDNKPTGILKATVNPNNAYTQDPTTNARLQATTPPLTYNLRMPGQYFDFETGLFYNTFRSYNSGQGRYTQNDPIGLEGGWNRFGYVGGNPLSGIDPSGLDIEYANHAVAAGFNHSKIIITPDNQALYVNDPRFQNIDADGRRFATLGAGPNGTLHMESGVNRPRDVSEASAYRKKLDLPCQYGDEDAAINNLFTLANSYNKNKVWYTLIPHRVFGVATGYNSNSFISGLGGAAGFDMPSPANTGASTPGYQNPVPASRYR